MAGDGDLSDIGQGNDPGSDPGGVAGFDLCGSGRSWVRNQGLGNGQLQLDVLFVPADGSVAVAFVTEAGTGSGPWHAPQTIAPAGSAVPGSPISLKFRSPPDRLDAVFVGPDGSIKTMWVVDAGPWNGPLVIAPPWTAAPASPVSLGDVGAAELDALFVALDGSVRSMSRVGDTWQGPGVVAGPGSAAAGSPVAVESQSQGNGLMQSDAVFVGFDGDILVTAATGSGSWLPPVSIAPAGTAARGSAISLAHQGLPPVVDRGQLGQLDAFFVAPNGSVNLMWVIGAGSWNGPVAITPPGSAVAGSAVAVEFQLQAAGVQQLDAVFVGPDGSVNVTWVVETGRWNGPITVAAPGTAASGGPLALGLQINPTPRDQLDAVFAGSDGALKVMSVVGADAWTGPTVIGPAGTIPSLKRIDIPSPDSANLIQGNWGGVGNYELVVPQGDRLVHYARLNDPGPAQFSWVKVHELSYAGVSRGPGTFQLGATPVGVSFLQTTFRGDNVHGNFDAVVRVTPPGSGGDVLEFAALDSAVNQWNRHPLLVDGQPITGVTGF
ncbi:hypothetical protein [Lapillicoccus sp.]|uniref:hypothetical protein n=1 Tax=Lapillicoccus sp. TaxID=1909287 RepID=UPI0025E1D190|nr:hypothetical protein [Lapillicoccus sp.]